MITDPLHEILVLLALVAIYAALVTGAWFILCGASAAAVRAFNAAIDASRGTTKRHVDIPELTDIPDLETTLSSLLAEGRLSPDLVARLRRITPVFHKGKWVAYPGSAYWAYRFERLKHRSPDRRGGT